MTFLQTTKHPSWKAWESVKTRSSATCQHYHLTPVVTSRTLNFSSWATPCSPWQWCSWSWHLQFLVMDFVDFLRMLDDVYQLGILFVYGFWTGFVWFGIVVLNEKPLISPEQGCENCEFPFGIATIGVLERTVSPNNHSLDPSIQTSISSHPKLNINTLPASLSVESGHFENQKSSSPEKSISAINSPSFLSSGVSVESPCCSAACIKLIAASHQEQRCKMVFKPLVVQSPNDNLACPSPVWLVEILCLANAVLGYWQSIASIRFLVLLCSFSQTNPLKLKNWILRLPPNSATMRKVAKAVTLISKGATQTNIITRKSCQHQQTHYQCCLLKHVQSIFVLLIWPCSLPRCWSHLSESATSKRRATGLFLAPRWGWWYPGSVPRWF